MSVDILDAAKRELNELRAKLAKNPDFIKLQQVQRLIDTYESLIEVNAEKSSVEASSLTSYRQGSKSQKVDEAVEAHFSRTGRRASSGELLPVIEAAGVQLGGTPSRTLASFLTNSKRFNNVKGFGYGLAEWGDKPGPKDLLGDGIESLSLKPDIFN